MECFDDATLGRFLEGLAPPDTALALDEHLRGCRACRDRLERLCSADPLVTRPGRGGDAAGVGGDASPDPVVHSWTGPLKAEFFSHAPPPGGEIDDDSPDAPLPALPGLEIRRRIGAGGMGVVFEAFDPGLKRRVAVKMLRGFRRSPESFARLRQEAEAAARISHPGIVQVHGLGESDGRPWLVLEYVDGPSLAERLGGKPHPPREAAALTQSIAGALAAAHRLQIVHRDVKPSNILLATEGHPAGDTPLSQLRPKIGDFGLAKVLDADAEMTREGQLIGTPTFAAPEQLRHGGAPVGPAADVYSLGAVLYTMLTGLPPLQSDDTWRTVRMVLEDEPVSARRLQPGVPIDLDTIVTRCLAKDPGRRYPDAGALADDLARFLAHEPIHARPIGAAERTWRWARRNPAVAASTTALAASLVAATVGAVVAAVHFRSLEQERDGQRRAAEEALDDSRRSLAESFRTIGLRQYADGQNHLAPVCFAEAARQLQPGDPMRRDNAIRTAGALRLCPEPVALLGDPSGPRISDVSFHASGRWLIARPVDPSHTPTLWEIGSGDDVALPPALGEATALAWDRSGERLVVGTGDGRVRVVTFPGFEPIDELTCPGAVRLVAIASDGGAVAAATKDRLRVWRASPSVDDSPTPRWTACPERPLDGSPADLAFDPDGRHLVTTSIDHGLLVHAIDAPPEAGPVLRARCGAGAAAGLPILPQFDAAGRMVVWSDGILGWFDLPDPTPVRTERLADARFCEVSPWSGRVATGGERRFVWFDESGAHGFTVDTRASGCWLPDGGILTGASESDTLIRWTPDFGHGNGWPLFQPDGVVRMRLSPDERLLATISTTDRIRVWRMPPEREPLSEVADGSAATRVSVSPDGTRLLALSARPGVRVYPLPEGSPAGAAPVPAGELRDAVWSGGGTEIVTLSAADGGATIERFAAVDGLSTAPPVHLPVAPAADVPDRHHSLAVSPDGRWAAFVAAAPKDVVIVSLVDPRATPTRVGLPARALLAERGDRLVFIADGEEGVSGDADGPGSIAVVEWKSGRIVSRHAITGITEVTATPGGERVASSDREGRPWFLDTASGELTTPRLPHPNRGSPAAFSADGRLLLTLGGDRNVRLWDWRAGTLVMPPASFPKDAAAVLAAGGRTIVLVRHDGICHLLGTADGQLLLPPITLAAGKPPGNPRRTTFSTSTDGWLVAIGGDTPVGILDLERLLEEPALEGEALVERCHLVTCHHLVDGRPIPLDVEAWDALWRRLAETPLRGGDPGQSPSGAGTPDSGGGLPGPGPRTQAVAIRGGDPGLRQEGARRPSGPESPDEAHPGPGPRTTASEGDGTRTRGLQRDRLAL